MEETVLEHILNATLIGGTQSFERLFAEEVPNKILHFLAHCVWEILWKDDWVPLNQFELDSMILVIERIMASTAKFVGDDSELPVYLGLENMVWKLFLVGLRNLVIIVYDFRRDKSLKFASFVGLLKLYFEQWSEILSLKQIRVSDA